MNWADRLGKRTTCTGEVSVPGGQHGQIRLASLVGREGWVKDGQDERDGQEKRETGERNKKMGDR